MKKIFLVLISIGIMSSFVLAIWFIYSLHIYATQLPTAIHLVPNSVFLVLSLLTLISNIGLMIFILKDMTELKTTTKEKRQRKIQAQKEKLQRKIEVLENKNKQ